MKPTDVFKLKKGDKLYTCTNFDRDTRKHCRTRHFIEQYVVRAVLPITGRIRVQRVATKAADIVSLVTYEAWRAVKTFGRTPIEAIRMKLAEERADSKRYRSAYLQAESRIKFLAKMSGKI